MHCTSSQRRPPLTGVCSSGLSLTMNSMKSGTPASVALPDTSSFGIMMSTRTAMVAISWSLKNVSARNFSSRAISSGVRSMVCFTVTCVVLGLSVSHPWTNNPAPTAPTAMDFKYFRLSIMLMFRIYRLQILFFHFVNHEFRGTHRQCQDGPCRVLVRLRDEGSAVDDEKILARVCLVEFVDHRFPRVVAHTCRAHLMDNPSRGRQSVLICFRIGVTPRNHPARGFNNLLERFFHVLRLLHLVVAPLVMEAKHRYSVLVDGIRIDLAIVIFACYCFSAS